MIHWDTSWHQTGPGSLNTHRLAVPRGKIAGFFTALGNLRSALGLPKAEKTAKRQINRRSGSSAGARARMGAASRLNPGYNQIRGVLDPVFGVLLLVWNGCGGNFAGKKRCLRFPGKVRDKQSTSCSINTPHHSTPTHTHTYSRSYIYTSHTAVFFSNWVDIRWIKCILFQ